MLGRPDQPHPPCASVTSTKRVRFAAAIEMSTAGTASACFHGNGLRLEVVARAFFHRRIGDLLS